LKTESIKAKKEFKKRGKGEKLGKEKKKKVRKKGE